MAALYQCLSADQTTINGLTPTNAVKAITVNGNGFMLCAYPNSDFASFGAYKTNTQALEIPGGVLLYALMPYANYTISQYSVTLATAWAVPDLQGGTIQAPGFTFADEQQLASTLSNFGGLLMRSNGVVINV